MYLGVATSFDFSCAPDHWVLSIHFTRTERLILRDPEPDGYVDEDKEVYVVNHEPLLQPVSALDAGTPSSESLQRDLRNYFASCGALHQECLYFTERIMTYASRIANRLHGRGHFTMMADLGHVVTEVMVDVEDGDVFLLPGQESETGLDNHDFSESGLDEHNFEPLSIDPGDAISSLLKHAREEGRGLADSTCSICLNDMASDDGELLVETPCKHVFHSPCIVRWLEMSCTCPLCRYRIGNNI
ncbi:hypothetical protein CDL15_Pgr021281 [Punica granatum]|nr:hypothetical protein CDL15_Pgr021281 [Punica granatum]